jgi:hypothetical protein
MVMKYHTKSAWDMYITTFTLDPSFGTVFGIKVFAKSRQKLYFYFLSHKAG